MSIAIFQCVSGVLAFALLRPLPLPQPFHMAFIACLLLAALAVSRFAEDAVAVAAHELLEF